MVFSRLIECACNFVMLRMKMLNTYVLHCNNSVPNSHCAPNHPYLESQGLNCEGHSSDRIRRMHMKGAQAAAKRSCKLPEHSNKARCSLLGPESILEREEKPSTRRKTSHVRLRSSETNPTYDRRGGRRKCRSTWASVAHN